MNIDPKLQVTRFKQLSPGALFIFHMHNQPIVALKARYSPDGGDDFILPLGPQNIEDHGPARLLPAAAMTVITFGSDFFLRLPAEADGWSETQPDASTIAVLVQDGTAYFRGNSSAHAGKFEPCTVKIADGDLKFGLLPTQTTGFAIRWELAVKDAAGNFLTILKHPADGTVQN